MSVRRAGISSSRETQLPVKGESVAEADVAYLFVVGFPYAAVAGGQGKIVEETAPVEHDRLHMGPSVLPALEKPV